MQITIKQVKSTFKKASTKLKTGRPEHTKYIKAILKARKQLVNDLLPVQSNQLPTIAKQLKLNPPEFKLKVTQWRNWIYNKYRYQQDRINKPFNPDSVTFDQLTNLSAEQLTMLESLVNGAKNYVKHTNDIEKLKQQKQAVLKKYNVA